jgi:hypothetical protein
MMDSVSMDVQVGGSDLHTFEPLYEYRQVVDSDPFATHSQLWWPVREIDGFGHESCNVCDERSVLVSMLHRTFKLQ